MDAMVLGNLATGLASSCDRMVGGRKPPLSACSLAALGHCGVSKPVAGLEPSTVRTSADAAGVMIRTVRNGEAVASGRGATLPRKHSRRSARSLNAMICREAHGCKQSTFTVPGSGRDYLGPRSSASRAGLPPTALYSHQFGSRLGRPGAPLVGMHPTIQEDQPIVTWLAHTWPR